MLIDYHYLYIFHMLHLFDSNIRMLNQTNSNMFPKLVNIALLQPVYSWTDYNLTYSYLIILKSVEMQICRLSTVEKTKLFFLCQF